MAFVGRKPTNAPLTSDDIPNGIISAADLASGISGLITWQSVKTSGFTAVAGQGYPCNTTSAAFTVTLPASPSAGDTIILVDYAGTFATNNLTINPNSLKIQSQTSNVIVSKNNEALTLTYVDSTSGWLITSAANEGTSAIGITYTVDFLVIAGGGGGGGGVTGNLDGGGGAGGYRNSYSTETSGGGGSSETSLTFNPGTVYTITIGAGGASNDVGSNSSISGTGLTTITSIGGGTGTRSKPTKKDGGSGGGGYYTNTVGYGTANQGFNGGSGSSNENSGGGGGAGTVGGNAANSPSLGGNGGNGLASSITGSSVTRGGGGGGGVYIGGTGGSAGTGGGGQANGGDNNGSPGTVNTGGGGGGASYGGSGGAIGGAGGSGVVILRMLTSKYSGTTTGSPTVSTSGSDTILVYNASGSYTG